MAPCKGIRNSDSEIPEMFACGIRNLGKFCSWNIKKSGILGFGMWNTAQGIRNPTNDWNPESKL